MSNFTLFRMHQHLLYTLVASVLSTASLLASVDTLSLPDYIAQNDLQAKATDEGLYYVIHEPGTGASLEPGAYVKLHFTGKRLDGTVFQTSERDEPFVFQLGYRQVILGWDIGLQYLKSGTKATLLLPPKLAYGSEGAGSKVPPNTPVLFELEVLGTMTEGEYDVYMEDLERRERKRFLKAKEAQLEADKQAIYQYTLDKKLRTKALPSGTHYSLTKDGKGTTLKPGDVVSVSYEASLLDGTVVTKSKKREPLTFVLGQKKVVDGWEQALPFFREGSKGYIIVPSLHAYGPLEIDEREKDGIYIPANSVMVFKIEIEDVTRGR